MLSKKRERVVCCNSKPIEKMSPEERDEYFKSFSGLTYAEFCDKYKNDTIEDIHRDMDKHIKIID